MKKSGIILLLILITHFGFSQQNIVKTNLLGWTWGKFNAQYERMLTDYSSASVSYSFISPYFAKSDLLGTFFSTINLMEARLNGHEIVLDYRLYNKNQPGPRGFYIGPYLRYTYMGFYSEFNNPFDNTIGLSDYDDYIKDGIDISRIGLGLKLGAHWIIGDHFSIDWNFFGLGADYYTYRIFFEGVANLNDTQYSYQDEEKMSFFLSGISTDLTLGWAF